MASSILKHQVYKEITRITQAISHPKRLEMIDVLSQKPFSVEELSKEISMTIASTSQHLQVLKSARLVETIRQGNFIIYSITDDNVIRLVLAIKELGFQKYIELERLISDFEKDKDMLESITLEELSERQRNEELVLIDVRSEDEYLNGHIEGALSVPVNKMEEYLGNLPKDKTIVAYCRGSLCMMAWDAIRLLQERKYNAIRLEEGYVEWKLKE